MKSLPCEPEILDRLLPKQLNGLQKEAMVFLNSEVAAPDSSGQVKSFQRALDSWPAMVSPKKGDPVALL